MGQDWRTLPAMVSPITVLRPLGWQRGAAGPYLDPVARHQLPGPRGMFHGTLVGDTGLPDGPTRRVTMWLVRPAHLPFHWVPFRGHTHLLRAM